MAMLFPVDNMPIPLEAQIAEVERELGMRQHVYTRRVGEKKMKQADADAKIATMQAVLSTLREVQERGLRA